MFKKLCWKLLKTYIISFVLSTAVNFVYYSIITNSAAKDYSHVIPLLLMGGFFINITLLMMSLPVLFLTYPHLWKNITVRILLYFSGPVVFIVSVLSMGWHHGDREIYLFTAICFIMVHAVFYYKLTRSAI